MNAVDVCHNEVLGILASETKHRPVVNGLALNSDSLNIVKFASMCIFSSKQRDLYDESFRDLVQAVLDGFNGTIFAYGQTGTGKTYTMQGTSWTSSFL